MYRRILVPTDGSEHTEKAVEQALDLAEKYDADVHAIYVVNTDAIPTTDVEIREQFVESGERIGREAVEAVASAAADVGVEATTKVLRGVPYEEILDYAENKDVDLIVMGTHGRTGLRHILLGSVAERVVRHTNVPVLLVRIAQSERRD